MNVVTRSGAQASFIVDGTTNGLITQASSSEYASLFEEALPPVTSSTAIFANAPVNTKEIWISLRIAGITLRTDGNAATAGALGCDFAKDSPAPLVISMNYTQALMVRAIANGGASTGYIIYRDNTGYIDFHILRFNRHFSPSFNIGLTQSVQSTKHFLPW